MRPISIDVPTQTPDEMIRFLIEDTGNAMPRSSRRQT